MASPTHPNLTLLRIQCQGNSSPITLVVVFQGIEIGKRRLNNAKWRWFRNPKPTQAVPEPVVSPLYLYRAPFNPAETPLFSSIPVNIAYNRLEVNPRIITFMAVPGVLGAEGLTPRLEYTVNYPAIAPEPLMYVIRPVLLLASTVIGIMLALATSLRSLIVLLIVPLLNLIGGRPEQGQEDDADDDTDDEDDPGEGSKPTKPDFLPPQ